MIYTCFCCSFETSTSGHSFRAYPKFPHDKKGEEKKGKDEMHICKGQPNEKINM